MRNLSRGLVVLVPICLAIGFGCGGSGGEETQSHASAMDTTCGGCPVDAGSPDTYTPPPGSAECVEFVNPHGKNIPPAGWTTLPGAKGGMNEDGFYLVTSTTGADVVVVDQGSGTVFGPYDSGTVIKYTEANGATPGEKKIGSTNGQAGAVFTHITGTGDFGVRLASGGAVVTCLVPPLPK